MVVGQAMRQRRTSYARGAQVQQRLRTQILTLCAINNIMRNLLVLISSFILNAAIAQSPLAKTKWALKDRELRAELNSEKIDTEEWYKRIRIEAGSLGSSLQAWFVSKSKIAKASQTEKRLDIIQGFSAFIPNEFQIIKENGNRFIQILLINNSDTSVPILRADATILGLSCFVKAGNEWILLRGGNNCFMRK
jgi:hypothetical protein